MERSSNILKRLDWVTVIIYLFLVIFGWINIYAAVYNEDHSNIFDMTQRYGKQLLWIAVAFVLIVIIFILDGKIYEFLAYPIYLIAILLLISVLLFGIKVHDARSWFEIGSFRLQPAEFTKLATALAIARLMSIYDFKINRLTDLAKVAFLVIIPFLLIILQNDTGSALVYGAFLVVLYREGLSPWYLVIVLLFAVLFILSLIINLFSIFAALPFLAIIIIHFSYQNIKYTMVAVYATLFLVILVIFNRYFLHLPAEKVLAFGIILSIIIIAFPAYIKRIKTFWLVSFILVGSIFFTFSVEYFFNHVLEKHQRTRINVVLGLESDPQGVEYNVRQSKIAIGSGEIIGKGFLQGTQTKFQFVPEQDTDFIFCTVGEEHGFLGAFIVLALFAGLLVRIILIAERQRSKMNRIYGYSVASLLFFHVAVNVGMTIGLAPVIGIPLPFFSYGGSSLWSFTLLLFILLRMDTTRMDKF